jgi:YVTN family beta-propeller protein
VAPGFSHPGPFPSFTIIRVFDTQTLQQVSDFDVPAAVSGCVFSPDGARLLCARNVLAADVAVIDTATNEVVTTIPAGFPRAIVTSPSGSLLYLANEANLLTIHDGATYALIGSVPLPATPLTMAVSADAAHLYAVLKDGSVADIDTATNTLAGVITGVATGTHVARDVTFAGGRAYVSTGGGTGGQEGVTVIDVQTRTILTRIPVVNPLELDGNGDGSRVFVSGQLALSTIDTATDTIVASAPLPDGPGQLALRPPVPFSGVIVDVPAQGARVVQPFVMAGWAADVLGTAGAPGIDAVHVWAFPAAGGSPTFIGAAEYGRPRSDVAALFGSGYLGTGYAITVSGLSPGSYVLTAFGHSTRTGAFSVTRQVAVTIATGLRMAVDTPVAGGSVSGSFTVAGWALDLSAGAGSGIDAVHVWAYPSSGAAPMFAGAAALDVARPDVATAFGAQFASAGFALPVTTLPPGGYTLIVYAHQASTGTFAVERAVSIVVTAPQPLTVIDLPATGASVGTSVRVAGWAIEVGAATGTGIDAVHVWAYPASGATPILIGVAWYGGVRPDVGAIFGSRYTPSGFDVTGSLPAGTYTIVAFAHSATTDSFRGTQSVAVTVY